MRPEASGTSFTMSARRSGSGARAATEVAIKCISQLVLTVQEQSIQDIVESLWYVHRHSNQRS